MRLKYFLQKTVSFEHGYGMSTKVEVDAWGLGRGILPRVQTYPNQQQ